MTVQAVSAVAARTADAADAVTAAPELYDFSRPMKLAREQAGSLLRSSETFAKSWNTELSARLRASCRVVVTEVTMMTYDDYVSRLPANTALVLSAIPQSEDRAIMQLPLPEALNWTSRMLGGAATRPAEDRAFSPVEYAIVSRLVSGAHDLMRYAFGAVFPETSVEGIQYAPLTAKAAGPAEAMIVARYEVEVDGAVSTVSVAVPAAAMTDPADGVGDSMQHRDPVALLTAQLDTVPVRISLQFQPTRVRPEAILGLVEGDLIRIAHSKNRPLDFAVEGQVMARAAVGQSGAQLACVIVDTQEAP